MRLSDLSEGLDQGNLCLAGFDGAHAQDSSRALGNTESPAGHGLVKRGSVMIYLRHVDTVGNNDEPLSITVRVIQHPCSFSFEYNRRGFAQRIGDVSPDLGMRARRWMDQRTTNVRFIALVDSPYERNTQAARDLGTGQSDYGVHQNNVELLGSRPRDELTDLTLQTPRFPDTGIHGSH